MNFLLKFLAFGALVCTSKAEIEEEDNVLVLTSDNFQEAIDKHEFIMVEWYAPWCGHCKALAPEYVHAAEVLKEENSNIKLAKIDATEHRDTASKYSVGGYPTLKFFRSGNPLPFKGTRTADFIIDWMKKKSGPVAVTLSSSDDAKELIDDEDVVVIGFFQDLEGFKAKNFLEAADSLDDYGYKFCITTDADILAAYDIKEDGIVVFKPFDEKRADFKGKPYNVKDIKDFIIPNSLPTLIEFESKYVTRIHFVSSVKGALYLIISSESEDYSSIKEMANKIAEEYKGKILTIIIDSAAEGSDRFIGMLGAEGVELPAMRFAYGWSAKYMPLTTGFNEENIRQFLQDQFAKKTTQITWSKSEEIPDDWNKEPVKVLVGKSLNDVVTSTKNVFVEFYAPWCGHCKALAPTWDKLGEKLKDRDDIVIGKFEATANAVDMVGVRSYPTLILFQGSIRNQVKYDKGDRSLEGLLAFLDERGIKSKDKMDKKDEL